MPNGIDRPKMEQQRDLQTELGAMLDRFRIAGLSAAEILEVMSGESEIWEHRRSREIDVAFNQLPDDPHLRPQPVAIDVAKGALG